ncbi:MAG: methionine adenosyltransferase, partial [Acholeplasmatales bacterium]|nr:methionine adenosyltransferase [Acholeplasmatales bacterium]
STVKITNNIANQSQNIDSKVDDGGAGDQGIMFGFATNETAALMPAALYYAHLLAKRLETVRKENIIPYLRPDGKTEVTIKYVDNVMVGITAIVVSASHNDDIPNETIKQDILLHVITPVIPQSVIIKDEIKYFINERGSFVISGPAGDSGLTGRKNIVDTYGGYARHGGGSFSGKDATKVDRSATYMARYIAKNIVASGVAFRCEIELSYVIGEKQPLSIFVDTFGTSKVLDEVLIETIKNNFDLSPSGIINTLGLRKPIFSKTTNYGHVGKEDSSLKWEKTDKTDIFKKLLK